MEILHLPGSNKILPAFKVPRHKRLSTTTAQALKRYCVCCDPTALVLQLNLSTHLLSPWLPEKEEKGLLVWVFFVFKQPSVEPLSEAKMPTASQHRGKPAYSRKAFRLSALHLRVPEDMQRTNNPMEIKATFFFLASFTFGPANVIRYLSLSTWSLAVQQHQEGQSSRPQHKHQHIYLL